MAWFIYGGKDSRDMGVIVERLPDLHRPMQKGSYASIPGRDGRLWLHDGGVDGFETTLVVNCAGRPLREIYAWLSGSGWLVSSNEPDHKIMVDMYAMAKDARLRLASAACYDSITVPIYCQPYRYFILDEVDELAESPATVNNPGTAESRPRITIRGNGDVSLMIGLAQLDFTGLTDGIIVDSEAMDCFSLDETQLLNGLASFDEFPTFKPGDTLVTWTGDVTGITIEKRCRDL